MKQPAKSVWLTAVALALGVAPATVSPAAAQTRTADISGGYEFTRVMSEGTSSTNIPAGWYADVAGRVSSMFSLVFEATGAYKTETRSEQISPPLTVSAKATGRLHTFMGGARVSARTTNPGIVPFAQVLVGAAHLSATVSASGFGMSFNESDSDTKTAMHLTGGVNLMASKRVGIRAAAGYRRIFIPKNEGGGENNFFFQAGVVVPLGK